MKKSILLSAVLATGLVAVQSHAATFTLTDSIDAAYDNTTSFDSESYTLSPTATKGVVYEVPVYFQVSNLGTGQTGFGNIDVILSVSGGQATVDSGYGYYPNPNNAYGSGKTAGTYFAANQSVSQTATTDEVVATISAGVASSSDPRYTMAQASPFLLGYFYVDMPGNATSSSTINVVVNAQSTNNSGVLTLDTLGTHNNAAGIPLIVPEPASIGMVGVGALGLLARRRRTA